MGNFWFGWLIGFSVVVAIAGVVIIAINNRWTLYGADFWIGWLCGALFAPVMQWLAGKYFKR